MRLISFSPIFSAFSLSSSCSWDIKDKNYFNREKTLEAKQSWDEYKKTCEQLDARKKQGLQLFVEHMDMLWI